MLHVMSMLQDVLFSPNMCSAETAYFLQQSKPKDFPFTVIKTKKATHSHI